MQLVVRRGGAEKTARKRGFSWLIRGAPVVMATVNRLGSNRLERCVKMDALKRPLRIPMEFSRYAEEKGIFELYEIMLKELLVHKPEDPLKFLHEFLGRKNYDGKLSCFSQVSIL